ncbi:MAG: Sir2 family NAD-dependent protein deacetylase [Thermodesulfobacteriota bacterium]
MEEKIRRAAREMKRRAPGVAFTGSGVSAESGISTYRDRGGLWDSHPKGASGGMLGVLAAYPEKAPEILAGFFDSLKAAEPNAGHRAIAALEEQGILSAVITQNVDNLHRLAGSRTVFELHGNIMRLRCLACGRKTMPSREEFFALAAELVSGLSRSGMEGLLSALPSCECRGTLRPDFVSFGESVQDLPEASSASQRAGFMLICGTSGLVYPAASLPFRAKEAGAFIVEVNPRRSELSDIADVFLQDTAAKVLPGLWAEISA